MNDINGNKDENAHKFALSAIRGREKERDREKQTETARKKCDEKCDLRKQYEKMCPRISMKKV